MLQDTQAESVILVVIAATYCEELASCLEDADQREDLDSLRGVCGKTLDIIRAVASAQAVAEGKLWPAFAKLSAAVRSSLHAAGGKGLLHEILQSLKLEIGFADGVKFASGAVEASRISFWEMSASDIDSLQQALAKVVI